MIALEPYPAYRKMGVDWLDRAPKHWQEKRISNLRASGAKTFTDGDWIESPFITDDGVRLIQTGNIGLGHYREKGFRFISDESFRLLQCTEVYPG
jgi:type I restriction enzyme S subunit